MVVGGRRICPAGYPGSRGAMVEDFGSVKPGAGILI